MSAINAISSRPLASQAAETQSTSCFTKEKIMRLALRILSALALLGAIVVGANVVAGTIAAWHSLTSPCLYILYKELWTQADHTFDLNDSQERQLASDYLMGCSFPQMLKLYSPETILQYDLVPLDTLRRDCYGELRYTARYRNPVSQILIDNANQLLYNRIITLEIHRMIVQNELGAILNLVNSTQDVETLF